MIRELLTGGDRRSIGRVDEVVRLVSREPGLFTELMECLWDGDAVVAMHAADAAEKASRADSPRLEPYRCELLGLMEEAVQKEMRWHLAVMIPRLRLNAAERSRAHQALVRYLEDRGSMVRTFAMQGLADLARQYPEMLPEVVERIRVLTRAGTAAMKARGRKLLAELDARR